MGITIPLSTKQIQFMKCGKKGIVFRAGIRSGKSYIACYKAIINAFKGRRQLMISFSYRTLKDVILYTLKECFKNLGMVEGRDFIINLSDMVVRIGKTEILLRSGDSPDSIRGLSVHDVYIDEAREFPDNSIFLIAIGRMSESSDGQWHITSSPKGKDWTWKLCEEQGSNVELIVQKTSENPFLPEGYEDELRRNYTTLFAMQELEASIVELGAGVINPNWFKLIELIEPIRGVRAWDTAVTIKQSSDYSAGALCDFSDNRFRIIDIVRDKYEYPDLKKKIIETAIRDGRSVQIALESVGQSKAFVDDLRSVPELRGYTIRSCVPKGDKLNRALPWVTKAEGGLVDVCRGAWNANFYNECSDFSADMAHAHDDQCFVAGTMIATSVGYRPIESIKVGDMILTPFGYNKVLKTFNREANVIESFGLIGTANHPVISPNIDEFTVRLDAVGKIYSNKKELLNLNLIGVLKWTAARSLYMMGSNSLSLDADIFTIKKLSMEKGILGLYIDILGKNITGKSLRGILSIISTVISQITILATYSAFQMMNIANCLLGYVQKIKKGILMKLDHSLKYGITQMRVGGAIQKLLKRLGLEGVLKSHNVNVSYAGNFLCPLNALQNFVVIDAGILAAKKNTLNTLKLNVSLVERNLKQNQYMETIELPAQKSAIQSLYFQEGYQVNSYLRGNQREIVYNIAVENCPIYYANDIMVHNCDAVSMAFGLLCGPRTSAKHVKLY